jgi:hypothetical protein
MCTTEVHSQATSLSWLLSLGCGEHWLSPHRARSRCNSCESDRRVTDSQWRGVERFPCRSDCYPLGLVALPPSFVLLSFLFIVLTRSDCGLAKSCCRGNATQSAHDTEGVQTGLPTSPLTQWCVDTFTLVIRDLPPDRCLRSASLYIHDGLVPLESNSGRRRSARIITRRTTARHTYHHTTRSFSALA